MTTQKQLFTFFFLFFILSAVSGFEYEEGELESEEGLRKLYDRWRSHHHVPLNVTNQGVDRFNVFRSNAKYIMKINKLNLPYSLALNRFANLTQIEAANMQACISSDEQTTIIDDDVTDARTPASVDWRKEGAVTDVKGQGSCGSCWAFSTVATVEGLNFIKTKHLISLSEQQLLDCSSELNNCTQGKRSLAFKYIKEKGITTQALYPYTAVKGKCLQKKGPSVTIDAYSGVPANNEAALQRAVARQPVTVTIDSSSPKFTFYKEGILTGECGTKLSHAMAAIGYGTEANGRKFWILKNSYGPEWGEDGYIRIEKDISEKEGRCGIARQPLFPIKKSVR